LKALRDRAGLLGPGLARIRERFAIPPAFPAGVTAAARLAAQRVPNSHVDRTAVPFVTLDPASSTDLDQAFAIETAGSDLVLHYAIADVGFFVKDGDPIDREAWARGTTTYFPDGKAGLHPPELAEAAASLLPDGPRPALILTTRIDPAGAVRLEQVERALVRSRAKLAYATVTEADLPAGFAELARRIEGAADRRGASRVDPPQQEVDRDDAGRYHLGFRPRRLSEDRNAALSLASNLAVADALYQARTGLFRVMPPPDARAEQRLRQTAAAFSFEWPAAMTLAQLERSLDPANPRDAALMLEIRRASNGASYVPWRSGGRPWHAALAATYVHATAPLRRLADRYVLEAVHAVSNGRPVAPEVELAFQRLPDVMAAAGARDGQVERAVVDLAEVALLSGQEGAAFDAVVTDLGPAQSGKGGARIQLCDLPVVARIGPGTPTAPGERLKVRYEGPDPQRDAPRFTRLR